MTDVYVDLYKGKSKKTGKDFECIKLTIGKWEKLVFPSSKFELDYIKKALEEKNDD